MILSLLPWIISREWTNDGKLASGAKIYTYQSGTNTPKQTYKDAAGTVPNTNPIICDASGSFTCFLSQGPYRILIKDTNDVQIMPALDGVIGGGNGGVDSNSTATTIFLQTYNDLRGLLTTPDFVYVAGRTTEGDGGQGWFQYIPADTSLDDDAVILTCQTGSKIYKRIFDGYIDPRWRGLKYGVSIDQSDTFDAVMQLSRVYGVPALFTGSTYVNRNITITSGAVVDCGDNGFFVSTLGVTMTFNEGTEFKSTSRAFSNSVTPKFGPNVCDGIKLSWMAGTTDDDRVNKWNSSSISGTPLILDEKPIVGTNLSFTAPIQPTPGNYITVTSATFNFSMTVPKILPTDYTYKIFDIKTTNITSLVFGDFTRPEWFGAVGNGIVNDYLPFKQSLVSGQIYLSPGKNYLVNGNLGNIGTVKIIGGGTWTFDTAITAYYLKMVGIVTLFMGSGNWLTATTFIANDSSISHAFTVTNLLVNGCSYYENMRAPVYDGQPSIYNAYLPLIKDAPGLYTDSNGKIANRLWQYGKSWTVTNFAGNSQYYNAIRYLNGNWIIVGNNGLIKTSTDFVTWTVRNSGTTVYLSDVAWNGTYYVICGDSSTYLRSTDLVTWTPAVTKPTTTGVPVFLATNGTRFVTTDRINGQVVSSSDGLNWSSVYSFGGSSGGMASYGNGLFVCGGNNGNIAVSNDGVTFTAKTVPSSPQFYTSFFDTVNGVWLLFSAGTVASSTDPMTNSWNQYPTGQTETIYMAQRVGDTIVAVGANGRIMTSKTGAVWTNRYSGTSSFMYGLAANGYDVYATGASELIIQADK